MRKMMFRLLLGLLFCLFSNAYALENYVVVHGKTHTLELYDGSRALLKTYRVSLGKNGMGKTKEGDQKTPVGEYRLIWKASCFWKEDGGFPIQEGRGFIGRDNNYSEKMRLSFRDGPLFNDDYGGSKAVFMCLDYPNQLDLDKGSTGFGIAIHGSLKGGIGEFASRGCIRMKVEEARDLYTKLSVGAKVLILPE